MRFQLPLIALLAAPALSAPTPDPAPEGVREYAKLYFYRNGNCLGDPEYIYTVHSGRSCYAAATAFVRVRDVTAPRSFCKSIALHALFFYQGQLKSVTNCLCAVGASQTANCGVRNVVFKQAYKGDCNYTGGSQSIWTELL
jgi:hypothetical protein